MLIVENLPVAITEAEVTELLARYGAVAEIQLSKVEAPGAESRTAFVNARSGKDGKAIITALDGVTHAGRVLKAKALKGRGGADARDGGNRAGKGLNKGDGRACSHGW